MSDFMENYLSNRPRLAEGLAPLGALVVALVGVWWTLPSLGDSANESGKVVATATSPSASDADRAENFETSRSRSPLPGQTTGDDERLEYKPAVLQIVTNFKKADASVNGLPYPEYVEPGTEPGMVLPAGGPYAVRVTYDGNTKSYTISLDPYEIRYLMVELSGFKGGSPSPKEGRRSGDSADRAGSRDRKGKGRVTVYSKPKGEIRVDGENNGQKTPGTIKVEPGEHELQVKFNEGKMSESKTVRVRNGSRIKLFFRKNDNDGNDGDENN